MLDILNRNNKILRIPLQTQDCNWRRAKTSVRRRRDLSGINENGLLNEDEEGMEDIMGEFEDNDENEFGEGISMSRNLTSTNTTDSLSDNISLFQAIHVLQSKEGEAEFRNDTTAGSCIIFLVNWYIN